MSALTSCHERGLNSAGTHPDIKSLKRKKMVLQALSFCEAVDLAQANPSSLHCRGLESQASIIYFIVSGSLYSSYHRPVIIITCVNQETCTYERHQFYSFNVSNALSVIIAIVPEAPRHSCVSVSHWTCSLSPSDSGQLFTLSRL